MAQIKDFVSQYCSQTQLDRTLVTRVTDDFINWIHNQMMQGENLRLPGVGTFRITLNTYKKSGLMRNGASLHYHEFRPSFRFCIPFRQEVDANADAIRKGVEAREEHKRKVREEKRKTSPTPPKEGLMDVTQSEQSSHS